MTDQSQSAKCQWQPPVPWAQADEDCRSRARLLQKALLRTMEHRQFDTLLSSTEVERLAIEDYKAVFNTTVSERHIRRLIAQINERDGRARNFSREEIYLDGRARPKRRAHRVSPAVEFRFAALHDALLGFKNPSEPNREEMQYLWLRVFEQFEESPESQRRRTQRDLIGWLLAKLPGIAPTAETLRKKFTRDYRKWLAGNRLPSAVMDKRQILSGNFRGPDLTADDVDLLKAHAVFNCGGRVAQAWRELRDSGKLSEAITSYYLANPADKSYVPRAIRELVKYDVAALNDIHHGPRQHKLNGAHILRDWSVVAAGDWYQGDDVTLPIYYLTPDGSLMRGQFLMMIDLRSKRILGYALQSERNYNARTIRTLITKVCDEHGLPRRGFYFEKGTWENSRILKGDRNADPHSWAETELGLRGIGLEFKHARLPRGKPIEGVIGMFHTLLEGDLGYAGRDERHDRFERVQKHLLEVRNGKRSAGGLFYTESQWVKRLDELCEIYNSQPQQGKMTCGLSPDAAFAKYDRKDDPPMKLGPDIRYLLANHKRPVRVTAQGITLRFGKQVFNYRDGSTGRLIGQQVLAWFNPEAPEILSVTDMKRENPFCVARTQEVPAMDAAEVAPELYQQELARIAAHQAPAKVLYSTLRNKLPRLFRPNLVDGAAIDLGKQFETNRAQAETGLREYERNVRQLQKLSKTLNTEISPDAARQPRRMKAARTVAEMITTDEAEESNS